MIKKMMMNNKFNFLILSILFSFLIINNSCSTKYDDFNEIEVGPTLKTPKNNLYISDTHISSKENDDMIFSWSTVNNIKGYRLAIESKGHLDIINNEYTLTNDFKWRNTPYIWYASAKNEFQLSPSKEIRYIFVFPSNGRELYYPKDTLCNMKEIEFSWDKYVMADSIILEIYNKDKDELIYSTYDEETKTNTITDPKIDKLKINSSIIPIETNLYWRIVAFYPDDQKTVSENKNFYLSKDYLPVIISPNEETGSCKMLPTLVWDGNNRFDKGFAVYFAEGQNPVNLVGHTHETTFQITEDILKQFNINYCNGLFSWKVVAEGTPCGDFAAETIFELSDMHGQWETLGDGPLNVDANGTLGSSMDRENSVDIINVNDQNFSDMNGIYVAYIHINSRTKRESYHLMVKRWKNNKWETIGESLNIDSKVEAVELDLNYYKGKIYIFWTESTYDDITLSGFAKEFDGTTWKKTRQKKHCIL